MKFSVYSPFLLVLCFWFTPGCKAPVELGHQTALSSNLSATYALQFSFLDFSPKREQATPLKASHYLKIIRRGGIVTEIQEINEFSERVRFRFQYENGVPRSYALTPPCKEQTAIFSIFKQDTMYDIMVDFQPRKGHLTERDSINYDLVIYDTTRLQAHVRHVSLFSNDFGIDVSYPPFGPDFSRKMLQNPHLAIAGPWETKSIKHLSILDSLTYEVKYVNEFKTEPGKREKGNLCFSREDSPERYIFPKMRSVRRRVPCPAGGDR